MAAFRTAQQTERVRRIGAITAIADQPSIQTRLAVFLQALQQLGWTDGRNVRIDYRYGRGDANNIGKLAASGAGLNYSSWIWNIKPSLE